MLSQYSLVLAMTLIGTSSSTSTLQRNHVALVGRNITLYCAAPTQPTWWHYPKDSPSSPTDATYLPNATRSETVGPRPYQLNIVLAKTIHTGVYSCSDAKKSESNALIVLNSGFSCKPSIDIGNYVTQNNDIVTGENSQIKLCEDGKLKVFLNCKVHSETELDIAVKWTRSDRSIDTVFESVGKLFYYEILVEDMSVNYTVTVKLTIPGTDKRVYDGPAPTVTWTSPPVSTYYTQLCVRSPVTSSSSNVTSFTSHTGSSRTTSTQPGAADSTTTFTSRSNTDASQLKASESRNNDLLYIILFCAGLAILTLFLVIVTCMWCKQTRSRNEFLQVYGTLPLSSQHDLSPMPSTYLKPPNDEEINTSPRNNDNSHKPYDEIGESIASEQNDEQTNNSQQHNAAEDSIGSLDLRECNSPSFDSISRRPPIDLPNSAYLHDLRYTHELTKLAQANQHKSPRAPLPMKTHRAVHTFPKQII